MTHMGKTIEEVNGKQIIRYGFENYQIIVSGNNYVIGPINMDIPEVLDKVSMEIKY